jgi:phospholipid/cholesterol/gamma-HCH transport system substrate-binding protein
LDAGGEEEKLKDGDRVTITQSAVVLERLISQFMFSKAQESADGASKPPAAGSVNPN